MRIRQVGVLAFLVAVSMGASALGTCLPVAMASMPDDHMAYGQDSDSSDRVSAPRANCCKSIEPVVLNKTESLTLPVLDVLHWMNAIVVVPGRPLLVSLSATVSPSPPGSGLADGPPRYVVFRTFLI